MRKRQWFLGSLSAVVVVSIGVGLYLIGSPTEARLLKTDERRISDLKQVRAAIIRYHRDHQRFPADLNALEIQSEERLPVRDAEMGSYGFQVIDSLSFQLCAEFSRPSRQQQGRWAHDAGAQCFLHSVEEIRAVR